MFDAPGAGDSADIRRPSRMPGLAALVVGVLDGLGLNRVDLLGYSWGGALAQQVAKDAHRRVRRLVLVATVPGVGGVPPPLRVATTMLSPRRFSTPERSWEAAGRIYGGDYRPGSPVRGSALRLWNRQPPSALGYGQQLFAIAGWTSLPWLHQVRARTLIISGDDDPLVPTAERATHGRAHPAVHVAHGARWRPPLAPRSRRRECDRHRAVLDRALSPGSAGSPSAIEWGQRAVSDDRLELPDQALSADPLELVHVRSRRCPLEHGARQRQAVDGEENKGLQGVLQLALARIIAAELGRLVSGSGTSSACIRSPSLPGRPPTVELGGARRSRKACDCGKVRAVVAPSPALASSGVKWSTRASSPPRRRTPPRVRRGRRARRRAGR